MQVALWTLATKMTQEIVCSAVRAGGGWHAERGSMVGAMGLCMRTGRRRTPLRIMVLALLAAVSMTGAAHAAPSWPTHRCGSFLHWIPPQYALAGLWYRIEVLHADVGCREAMAVIETFWSGEGVHHGGQSDAASWWTLPRHPGWECREGAGAGSCTQKNRIAAYEVTIVRNVPPADPCALKWPGGLSKREHGGRLVYSREQSLRMVCQGFGTDTGGLHIDWLTPGMRCALIATALAVRYGDTAGMVADGVCSAKELVQHPGVVSALGTACSTASDLLGLSMQEVGQLSGLLCAAAPAVGTGFGTKLESHHEFAVAKDVLHRHKCLEYRHYLGVSTWHAVRCLG